MLTEEQRLVWAAVQADYAAAVAIARKIWPDASPEVQHAASATLLIEHGKRRLSGPPAAQAAPGAANGTAAVPSTCPDCGGPLKPNPRKRGNQPDYRCAAECGGAVWLTPKPRGGSR